jgi:hypothetical protein
MLPWKEPITCKKHSGIKTTNYGVSLTETDDRRIVTLGTLIMKQQDDWTSEIKAELIQLLPYNSVKRLKLKI